MLVGAGYQVSGATGEVIVDDFVPTVGPTGSVLMEADRLRDLCHGIVGH